MSKLKHIGTIGSILAVILTIILLINSSERQEEASERLQDATNDLDKIVDKAIAHCETKGFGCNEIIPQWLEECQKSEMKDIPSCHDGRIEKLMNNRVVTMSNECHLRLATIQNYEKDIYGNFDEFAYQDSISYFEELCGKYETLLDNNLSKESTMISKQTTISQECMELKEIMEQNRYDANNNDPIAIGEFGYAMNEYNKLGCP